MCVVFCENHPVTYVTPLRGRGIKSGLKILNSPHTEGWQAKPDGVVYIDYPTNAL